MGVGLDFLAVEFKLVIFGAGGNQKKLKVAIIGVAVADGQWRWQGGGLCCSSIGHQFGHQSEGIGSSRGGY
jgi:hypothetical protein